MMKRFLPIVMAAFLLSACDDGDLTFENIDFDDVSTARCGNKLYKLNEKEALILNVGTNEDQFNSIFVEEATVGAPVPINIGMAGANIVFAYRLFDGAVTSATICDAIPPLNPTAIENWTATEGFMQITTTANLVPNTTTGFEGGQKIQSYRHNIIFTDVNFDRSSGTSQLYPIFNFGTFEKTIEEALPITFDQEVDKCPTTNVVYNIAGNHATVLQIDPTLINGTTLDTPQLGTVDATTNSFTYYIYEDEPLLGATHFCTTTPDSNPTQVWQGTGQIEVTSTQVGTSREHTIVLKNIVLTRGNNSFILATEYDFGILVTQ